ncbi:hypothetical protein [Acidithiobacillus sulfurivorans]|uniref:Uncharacterized protein n=1 Tax=Acidithiobacillus sulfurivorans TaxID=1958756 RepID=A0ABS6A210_9PROT|nr:hypothetical protein [Acidithiobacillus sulfurivorans]MBU2761398.1 hypothetical protein [Acidithiobacillus sulfurivorans]
MAIWLWIVNPLHERRITVSSGLADVFRCMSLLWLQRNPLLIDWMAQREVVTAFKE